jgi:hypothetical protein
MWNIVVSSLIAPSGHIYENTYDYDQSAKILICCSLISWFLIKFTSNPQNYMRYLIFIKKN